MRLPGPTIRAATRAVALLVFLASTTSLAAQADLSKVEWNTNMGSEVTLSADRKSLTLQLPAVAQIYQQFGLGFTVHFSGNVGATHSMVPVQANKPNILTCYEVTAGKIPSTRRKTSACKIEAATAKALTSDQTITVTVAGTNGNKTLTATLKRYVGPNSVAPPLELVTKTIYLGDLATFRVRLMAPVPSGQTQVVGWGLTPQDCFHNTSLSSPYNPEWSLPSTNIVTFQAGESQRDITVRVGKLGVCAGANRLLEVWSPNTPNVQSAPTYNKLYFTILKP